MAKIVTISREFGSGGRTIGKAVAQKLGVPYYDKALIKQVAEETDGTVNMITSLLSQLVLLLPLAWAFGRLWGVSGVWYAFWIAEAAAFAFAVARCVRDLRSVQNTQR